MKLVQELLILTCHLLFSILTLIINLSFFSEPASKKAEIQKVELIKKPLKPIKKK